MMRNFKTHQEIHEKRVYGKPSQYAPVHVLPAGHLVLFLCQCRLTSCSVNLVLREYTRQKSPSQTKIDIQHDRYLQELQKKKGEKQKENMHTKDNKAQNAVSSPSVKTPFIKRPKYKTDHPVAFFSHI